MPFIIKCSMLRNTAQQAVAAVMAQADGTGEVSCSGHMLQAPQRLQVEAVQPQLVLLPGSGALRHG